MKKLLTVLALIAFTGSVMAATSPATKFSNWVNKTNNSITKAENNVTSKIQAEQKARAKKQAEIQKQKAAQEKAAAAKKAELQKQKEANEKAIAAKKQAVQNKTNETKQAVENNALCNSFGCLLQKIIRSIKYRIQRICHISRFYKNTDIIRGSDYCKRCRFNSVISGFGMFYHRFFDSLSQAL